MIKFKKFSIFVFSCLLVLVSLFAFIPKNNLTLSASSSDLFETEYFNVSSTYYDRVKGGFHSIRVGSYVKFFIYSDSIVVANYLSGSTIDQTDPNSLMIASYNYERCYLNHSFSSSSIELGLYNTGDNKKHTFWGNYGFSSNNFDFSNLTYLTVNSELSVVDNNHILKTYFKIFDKNGSYFIFFIEYKSIHQKDGYNPSDFYYSHLIFYRNFKFLFNSNSSYNMGYNQGYNQGLNSTNNKGYQEGYNLGKNEGYNQGYNQALQDSESYSFSKLFTSVIDAPIHVLTSMFNFEFMGVNLSFFFMGLITFCVVIFVIRLILGGKS